jgi:hypothetical protein
MAIDAQMASRKIKICHCRSGPENFLAAIKTCAESTLSVPAMSTLTSRIRARFNHLFPAAPAAPIPGPKPTGASFDSEAKIRRRIVLDPIHPDFLGKVDPLWPIPEEALKNNQVHETSMTKRLHPHTAFGKHGFGVMVIPETVTEPIQKLVECTPTPATVVNDSATWPESATGSGKTSRYILNAESVFRGA